MKLIKPKIGMLTRTYLTEHEILNTIELAGRTAYKSEDRITEDSALRFFKNVCGLKKHLSVSEHVSLSVRVVCDRGVSHEIVRHRIASYTQESTRYCNYSTDKHDRQLTFIDMPKCIMPKGMSHHVWYKALQHAEEAYMYMVTYGVSPQIARSVLPNALKTEIVITMNLRQWFHFFFLRCAKEAHPQMRQISLSLYNMFNNMYPSIFPYVEEYSNDYESLFKGTVVQVLDWGY